MSDRNNSRTIEGIRERISKITASKSQSDAHFQYAYLLGWIAALYWADEIDKTMQKTLADEIGTAFEAWQPPHASETV